MNSKERFKLRIMKHSRLKKHIGVLETFQKSISARKNEISRVYNIILSEMEKHSPDFVGERLNYINEDTDEAHRNDPIQKCDQEVQVSIESSKNSVGTNTASEPDEPARTPLVNGGTSVPCTPSGSSISSAKKSKSISKKEGLKRRLDPNVVIKVEDSGSNDSEEEEKIEHLINRMMVPCSAPMNPTSSKSLLHYVVIENLPIRTTADEVINELFIGLLGITREEVTGITVHNEKNECIAQIYFKDLKNVQKILVFSGKLVFNGRVITSKIGTT